MIKKVLIYVMVSLFGIAHSHAQNALDFDGANDYVQTTYAGVTGSNDRTFEAWVYISSTPSSNMAISDYGINAVGSRNTFYVNANLQLGFISGGTNANISSSTGAVTIGQWNHVAFVLSSGTGFLYVNGVQVGTGSLTSVSTPTNGTNLRIGQRVPGGSIPFNGKIDEVRIWNVARTGAEIFSNMNSEFCVIPTSLKAYYKCNQGVASGTNTGLSTLNDNSGNSNNGTLTNFALSGSSSNWVTGASVTSGSLQGGTTSVTACIPYTTAGNQVLTATGVYPDTVLLPSGCDSSYTLNFTALASSSSTITTSACDFYFTPSGGVLNSTGVFYDTLVNSIGCDSIITINLTVNSTTGSTITTTNCSSYTSPLGNVYTVSGTYVDTFQNAVMCDSLVTINLTIVNAFSATLTETVCDSYTAPSGQVFTTSGTHMDTVFTGTPCDSVFTINLTVNQSNSSTVTESACFEYISDIGNSYTSSGTYTETVMNAAGCDSVITLNLTITQIDVSVTTSGFTLTATAPGLTYRWLDCDDNYAPISGGNQQSFTPGVSGNYAVKITDGSCSDTSLCVPLTNVSVKTMKEEKKIRVYPNPTTHNLTIENNMDKTSIFIYSSSGKLVANERVGNGVQNLDVSSLPSGIYYIKYNTNKKSIIEKLIIQ